MVGLFSNYNIMEKYREDQVNVERDEDDEHNSLLHVDNVYKSYDYDDDDDDDDDGDGNNDHDDGDFMPIEHPLEPPEDDQPAKCPMMPDLSFIYDDGGTRESFPETPKKRAESLMANEADAKKQHRNAQNSANAQQLKGSQYNIFDAFQQCKEFGFS